jgi:hypothetical protein
MGEGATSHHPTIDSSSRGTQKTIDQIMAKAILKDFEMANIHLTSHVTREGKILQLDKNCECCHIYFEQ